MKEIQSKRELNKAKKKASFLKAAEKLFKQNGFENTSIDEVAKEAGLTKRTLYQYFQSKEDLFYAVALKGAQQLYSASEDAVNMGKNALEKIRLANMAHLQFYTNDLEMFRLLNYRPANRQNCEASPHYREIKALDALRIQHLREFVAAGRSDGSISTRLDLEKAVFFAFYSAFSLLYTISSTNKSILDTLQLDEKEFLRFSFDLLVDALK